MSDGYNAFIKENTVYQTPQVRQFETGAIRSPLGDKLQYEGYLSPLVLRRFAQYMKKHQTDTAGNQRAADNWQKGIDRASYMDSMTRHFIDVWLHHDGYADLAEEDQQEALAALMFNTMGYLHEVLLNRDSNAKP